MIPFSFPLFLVTAAAALVAASWQGLLLAGAIVLLLQWMPGLAARRRWVVWAAAFLLMAALHLAPALRTGRAVAAGNAHPLHLVHLGASWGLAIGSLWLIFSVVRLSQLAYAALRLNRLARAAKPFAVPESCRLLLAGAASGSGRVAAEVYLSPEVNRPSVAGFTHPRILLPPSLPERLSEAELGQVLLHECEHLRRGDLWTNLIQKLALAIFPLNPALAWVERRLCAERELACDDRVLAVTGAPKAYALCLTRLAEAGARRSGFVHHLDQGLALALGAWHRRPELARRVYRILELRAARPVANSRWSWPVRLGQSALLASVLLLAADLMVRTPELVQFGPTPVALEATGAGDLRADAQLGSKIHGAGRAHLIPMRLDLPDQGVGTRYATEPTSASKPVCQLHRLRTAPHRLSVHRQPAGVTVVERLISAELPATELPAKVPRFERHLILTSFPSAHIVRWAQTLTSQDSAASAAASTSNPPQPRLTAIVPVANGWIVFEL